MNPPFHRTGFLLTSVLCSLGTIAGYAADPLPLYSGDGGFRQDWQAHTWGGVKAAENQEAGRKAGESYVEVSVSAEAEAYAGMAIRVGYGKDGQDAGVPLTEELRNSGVVTLHVNGGKDAGGSLGSEIPLQCALAFVAKDGSVKTTKFMPMSKVSPDNGVDADPATWQELKIPLKDAIAGLGAAELVSLSGVSLQYAGEPVAGIAVTDCSVHAE